MHPDHVRELLSEVQAGRVSIDEATERLRGLPFESLGFATLDHHRALRCGAPEVIFCEGKSSTAAAKIFERLAERGHNVLATRARPKHFERIARRFPDANYHKAARCITLRQREPNVSSGTIAIVSAGTSDEPVAEEARVTAEILDQRTASFYDVGVAGLHRLLAQLPELHRARVIVVVAGMEGALPSVVGGLVDVPVIAVPTSVGYGASFGGLAALLTMLNSCASGVSVVNINNGFGAGYLAAMINRLADRPEPPPPAPRS
ncbi:MAG: nickel pincer cofactor biosynthesis protein LarB [Phycisphaerae bacterium]